MSPSPFKSPEDQNNCYITEKGEKRLRSALTVKIPNKTLYVIDKVVRKKLRKEALRLRSMSNAEEGKDLKSTFSPLARHEENKFLQVPGEKLDFMTPERKQREGGLSSVQR